MTNSSSIADIRGTTAMANSSSIADIRDSTAMANASTRVTAIHSIRAGTERLKKRTHEGVSRSWPRTVL